MYAYVTVSFAWYFQFFSNNHPYNFLHHLIWITGPVSSPWLPPETHWSRCARVWSRSAIFKHPPSPSPQIEKKREKSFCLFPTALLQQQWGRAAFLQSDVHLRLERVHMHAAVLPVFVKTWAFFISLIIFISSNASWVTQFHLTYDISLPWVGITIFKFPSYMQIFSQERCFCGLVAGKKDDLRCISSCYQHKPTVL